MNAVTIAFISAVSLYVILPTKAFAPISSSCHTGPTRHTVALNRGINYDLETAYFQHSPRGLLPPLRSTKNSVANEVEIGQLDQFKYTAIFLSKAVLLGVLTGLSVVLFKSSIGATQILFYENLADYLPKPSFYWPLALYPLLGGIIVSVLTYAVGPKITNGIDIIAQSIDADTVPSSLKSLTPGDYALSVDPVAINFNLDPPASTI